MKIVLSGYYGFQNVGDEAILLSIINALKLYNNKIEITVLSNDPEYTKKQYGVDSVNRWKIQDVFKAIKKADGVISGGGSLLQDKTGLKSIPYYTSIMGIALILNKPFYIYAQGIGPVSRPYYQKLIKYIVSKATILSVRDEDSLKFLKKIGVKKQIDIVPDPVIGLSIKTQGTQFLQGQGVFGKTITVSIRDWPASQPYKEKVAKALDSLATKGFNIVFIPMHGEHDYHSSAEVKDIMKKEATIYPYDAPIEEKISVIGESHLLVGMRLHALIFAAITYTPMVGISYDPKIDSFLEMVDQPLIGHVDENWTAELLSNVISNQLEELAEEQNKLKETIDSSNEKANQIAKNVIETLKKEL